jgi:secondary thiamine-phosphate synthase enzyme
MKAKFKEIKVSTRKQVELVNITSEIEEFVRESGIANGICLIYAPHSTAAIIATEHESGLIEDVIKKVREDYPRGIGWLHDRIDDNANSHLASAFISSARIFPIRNRVLIRGTWQNIFLLELDGPRHTRKIIVEVLGE